MIFLFFDFAFTEAGLLLIVIDSAASVSEVLSEVSVLSDVTAPSDSVKLLPEPELAEPELLEPELLEPELLELELPELELPELELPELELPEPELPEPVFPLPPVAEDESLSLSCSLQNTTKLAEFNAFTLPSVVDPSMTETVLPDWMLTELPTE